MTRPSESIGRFQHTAARRRLAIRHERQQRRKRFNTQPPEGGWAPIYDGIRAVNSFNTQPPEGGWLHKSPLIKQSLQFQHTAARRRLVVLPANMDTAILFQHTAARRRLEGNLLCTTTFTLFQHTAARRRLENHIHDH